MSLQDEVKVLQENQALRKQHTLSDRMEPRGEPGEAYKALRALGGTALTEKLIPAVAARLLGNENPLTMERRARIAIERAIKTGFVNLHDGVTATAEAKPTQSATGVC
jgi:hypothetical protein